jgi:hypothetical protein
MKTLRQSSREGEPFWLSFFLVLTPLITIAELSGAVELGFKQQKPPLKSKGWYSKRYAVVFCHSVRLFFE